MDSETSHNLRDWDPGGGALCLRSCPSQAASCLFGGHFPAPTFPGRAGGRAWGRPGGQEHPSRLLPGAAAESPQGKRAGRSAGCRGPRDPSGRPKRKRELKRRARSQGPESSAAGGVWVSDLDCEPRLCWGGVEGRLLPPSLPQVPSIRQCATGTLWPLAQGAGPARRRRRVGPPRVPGEPTGFPRCLPWPPPQSWRRKGAGRLVGATQSFQRHFQGVGSELFCRARTEGRSDSARARVEPALDTQPSA